MVRYKVFDVGNELFDTLECSATNRPLGDKIEPDFHLIQPRSVGGCKMNLETRMGCKPPFDVGVLMGSVVIDH